MSRLATFRHWFSRSAHPALLHLARQGRRDFGRFIAWLDRFLTANKLDLAYYAGLALVGVGLTLKWGLWLGLLVPGAASSLAIIYLLTQKSAPPKSTSPAQRS